MKKILVPGGTGAMGVYLVPELLKMGYKVDVISLIDKEPDHPNVRYIKDNARDIDIMREYLKNDYDAVVDFMVYYKDREEHRPFIDMYLENTSHYIYLSTYRVYANEEHPIKETSPRLLDVSTNEDLLRSSDYCIHKALGEEYLRSSGKNNWTVVRNYIFPKKVSTCYTGDECCNKMYERRNTSGSSRRSNECSGYNELGGRCGKDDFLHCLK